MKPPNLVGAAVLVMLTSTAAAAQSDCHSDMKDMLQGTLEMSKQATDGTADDKASQGCTMAHRKGAPSVIEALVPDQPQPHPFLSLSA